MLVILQLRLTSPFLGELNPDKNGVRRFRRDGSQRVVVNQNKWLEDLAFAARTLRLAVNIKSTITPPAGILPAGIHLYKRVYSGVKVEMFESFRKGAILTMDMLLRDDRPGCPTCAQLYDLLGFVGEHCGISQWGSKFNFGRFSVVNLQDRFQPDTDQQPCAGTTPDLAPPVDSDGADPDRVEVAPTGYDPDAPTT